PLVADRSILVPTLHDEPPARLAVFDAVFDAARVVVFNTPEEAEFAAERFSVGSDRSVVAGLGVDPAPTVSATAFAAERGLTRPYVVCVGRLDPSKGTDLLVEAHRVYRDRHPDGADLVLVGRGDLELPALPWLTVTGFVDDLEKHRAIAGAAVVALPSPYESLSISQLDAWNHARPTLANAASPVLVGQSRRAGGGLWFADADEYATMLDFLVANPALADAIGRQGRACVGRDYGWDTVGAIWRDAVNRVVEGPGSPPVSG
ncbi:MAG: glycosyltransferase family 4 protein, partial [Phycisphaerales bacterium]|nr:glycosyltransferase family 4 protein [Phycisphaerales bacterium]